MNHEEYLALKASIAYHMDRYYNQDAPEISDYTYDQMMQQLKAAEQEHPEWVEEDSPSQRVGGQVTETGNKVIHNVPMLSIEDVFKLEDVEAWVNKVLAVHPDAAFSVEHKIDGASLTLRYGLDSGSGNLKLTMAETRGTGFEGENALANAREISDIPQELPLNIEYLELRGEVFMTHEAFQRFNEKQEALGKDPAANPRNLAAGTLRQLDARITKERGLSMFIFNVQDGPREWMSEHCKALDNLSTLGVSCVPHVHCRTPEEVLDAVQSIGQARQDLPYDIDGAVVKLDQVDYRADFPSGSKYSPGHIAYKFPPEERVVVIDEILVDVGRTGKLTFTGVFHDRETGKPARLAGTNVSRATLHNQDYINGMKIGVGGSYRLLKSGDIIPKLMGCVEPPDQVFTAPEVCPVCGEKLIREPENADIRCINPACHAQLVNSISYFTSVNCMNIMGLGDTIVEALVKTGYLESYADIYQLKNHREQLIANGVIGREKNTDKILAAIEGSKANSPVRLLTALGIRNVGTATAGALMRRFQSIDALSGATMEELVSVPDVGETTAACIYDFFRNESNQRLIAEIKASGVNMDMPQEDDVTEKLKGLIFVVTGTLPNMGRSEIKALIEKNGGKCTGSVSKKTNYLVAGDNAGSKLNEAQSRGVPIISESEFLEMLT